MLADDYYTLYIVNTDGETAPVYDAQEQFPLDFDRECEAFAEMRKRNACTIKSGDFYYVVRAPNGDWYADNYPWPIATTPANGYSA